MSSVTLLGSLAERERLRQKVEWLEAQLEDLRATRAEERSSLVKDREALREECADYRKAIAAVRTLLTSRRDGFSRFPPRECCADECDDALKLLDQELGRLGLLSLIAKEDLR
jgi:hypothetical protein